MNHNMRLVAAICLLAMLEACQNIAVTHSNLADADNFDVIDKACGPKAKDVKDQIRLLGFTTFGLSMIGLVTGGLSTYLAATGAAAHSAGIAAAGLIGGTANGAIASVPRAPKDDTESVQKYIDARGKYLQLLAKSTTPLDTLYTQNKPAWDALAGMKLACANLLLE